MRVLIADDHEFVRVGVRDVLDAQPGISVVATVATGEAAVERVQAGDIDLLILDMSLPGMDGLEVLKRVRVVAPDVAVIVLTMYPEDQLAWHIIRLGAAAYLNKARPAPELVAAVQAVASGRRYITSELDSLAFEHQIESEDRAPHHQLTTREYHVFLALIAGKTVNQTAEDLGLAASTVSNHVAAIRDKLGAGSISEIVLYAHRAGLL